MNRPRFTYTLLFLLFAAMHSAGQAYPKGWYEVLNKKEVGKEFIVGAPFDKNPIDLLRYLGTVADKSGATYQVISYKWVNTETKETRSGLLIFDQANKFKGRYDIDDGYEAVSGIKDGAVIFRFRKRKGCMPDHVARFDFNKAVGIPGSFFFGCGQQKCLFVPKPM